MRHYTMRNVRQPARRDTAAAVLCVVLLIVSVLASQRALAHAEGTTTTNVSITPSGLDVIFTAPTAALTALSTTGYAGADPNRHLAVGSGFTVTNGDAGCPLSAIQSKDLSTVKARQFSFRALCDTTPTNIRIDYNLFFDADPGHLNVTHVTFGAQTQSLVFSANTPSHSLPLGSYFPDSPQPVADTLPTTAAHYFPAGISQLWQGMDHLVFLLALLLVPLGTRTLIATVLTFTVAHSLSLALPFFDRISVSLPMVEALMAVSVVYIAIDNLVGLRSAHGGSNDGFTFRRLIATFLFGLVHGMAFTANLSTEGAASGDTGALLFYSLGLEAGQLAVVVLAYPVLLMAFRRFPTGRWAQVASLALAAVGSHWLIERSALLV